MNEGQNVMNVWYSISMKMSRIHQKLRAFFACDRRSSARILRTHIYDETSENVKKDKRRNSYNERIQADKARRKVAK